MLTAIKEITHIKDHQLTMHIPDDFHYEKVEVLILPFEESVQDMPHVTNKLFMDKVFKDAKNTIIAPSINIDNLMQDMNNALS